MTATINAQELNNIHINIVNDLQTNANLKVKEFDITLARRAAKIDLNFEDFKNIVNGYTENVNLFDFLNKINYFSDKVYSKTLLRKAKDLCNSICISKNTFLELGQKYLSINNTVILGDILQNIGLFSLDALKKTIAENQIKAMNTVNNKNQQDLTNTINKHIVEQILKK